MRSRIDRLFRDQEGTYQMFRTVPQKGQEIFAGLRGDAILAQESGRQLGISSSRCNDVNDKVHHRPQDCTVEENWGGSSGTPVITPRKLVSGSPTFTPVAVILNSRRVSS